MDLKNLKSDDYLTKGYDFWKDYRESLTFNLNNEEKIEKTKENIINMALKIGVKPTARYFEMAPKTVRSYLKEFNDKS